MSTIALEKAETETGGPNGCSHVVRKGQMAIPLEIFKRYGLTAGTQVEFVEDGGAIRLLVRRRVTPADLAARFGLVRGQTHPQKCGHEPTDFAAATLVRKKGGA